MRYYYERLTNNLTNYMTLMTLIINQLHDPKMCEIVNTNQKYFHIEIPELLIKNILKLTIIGGGKMSNLTVSVFIPDIPELCWRNAFYSMVALFIMRHCIAVLPCFTTIREALLSAPVLSVHELEKYAQNNDLLTNL